MVLYPNSQSIHVWKNGGIQVEKQRHPNRDYPFSLLLSFTLNCRHHLCLEFNQIGSPSTILEMKIL